jgi:hypothetical protein
MTRVSLWMLGIGLCSTVGLITLKQGYEGEEDDGATCTLKTLKGQYLFGGITTLLPPAVEQQSLLAVAGYRTFHISGLGLLPDAEETGSGHAAPPARRRHAR